MKTKIFLFTLIMAATFGACKKTYVKQEAATRKKAKSVKIIKPELTTRATEISASGVLASQKEITFSFKIGGIIDRLMVDQGETVQKGQLLAKLDLSEINAQVVQAENAYEKAIRDLNRAEALYADTVATLEQKQNAQTGVEVSKAELDIARFNQRYAKIVAPFSGKVLRKIAEEGELVGAGQPIFEVGSTGSKGSQVIRIGVADRSVVKLRLGDKAEINFDAIPNKSFTANITEISEEANPMTGTFDVELTLNAYHPELRNGFVGFARIQPSETTPHYQIPMSALIEGEGKQAKIFTSIDKSTVEEKEVAVMEIKSDYFTIDAAALNPSEWLVMEGGSYLNHGDSISVIN